jgi:mannose-1-phosphate guanylyltransferase
MFGFTTTVISHRTSLRDPDEDDSMDLDWTVALAGGEGVRLGDYVAQRFGYRMPKQYCRFVGTRSMLEHTLDRLAVLTPRERTLTVIGTRHRELAHGQLAGRSDHVFCQPASRDTGLALYVALAMIKRWHPNAVVTITPCDHYVAPANRYVEIVRRAREVARRLRDTVVVLGARADHPDPDFGYLSLGAPLIDIPQVRRVTGFIEKPPIAVAQGLIVEGALWNTMVVTGSIDALWALGRLAQPALIDILDDLVPLIGTVDEDDAIAYVYRALLPIGFSRDILERTPERIHAMALDGIEWSDWGRPERIEAVLAARRARSALRDRQGEREREVGQALEP